MQSSTSADSPHAVSEHPHSVPLAHCASIESENGMLEFSFSPSSSMKLTKVTGRAPL